MHASKPAEHSHLYPYCVAPWRIGLLHWLLVLHVIVIAVKGARHGLQSLLHLCHIVLRVAPALQYGCSPTAPHQP